MATDILFNFYEILVENIFGSVGLAIIGIYVAILLILLITRNTPTFIAYWSFFYFMVMATFYLGSIGIILAFLIAGLMTAHNIIKSFGGYG